VTGRFTKYEYSKAADHQNQETKTPTFKQEHLTNQKATHVSKPFPVVLFNGVTTKWVIVFLRFCTKQPSELSA
jgi:hypothetical protein